MVGRLIYVSKKNNGGYGDRLVGMASAATIARLLGMEFSTSWEPDFQKVCDSSQAFATIPADYIDINCYNQKSHPVLESENILETWKEKTILFQANQPVDGLLWKNPHLQTLLQTLSYEEEARKSYKELFTRHIKLNDYLRAYTEDDEFAYGIQIRCGDTYCMPHALAQQYIPEEQFDAFTRSIKDFLLQKGIKGRVYVTSDARCIYPFFQALSDTTIQFIYWNRAEDIHFDFYNSANKYVDILRDHVCLQSCKGILTSLRSNFGTTAAYCSPTCKELTLFTSSWASPLEVEFRSFPTTQLILKEYPHHTL